MLDPEIAKRRNKELLRQLEELGLIEGGKLKPFQHPDKTKYGTKEGKDALHHIARRSLVGLRKIYPKKDSNVLTIHDATPVAKNNEYAIQAMLLGDRGELLIQNFLYVAELNSANGAIPSQANYFQFLAPRAGIVRRIKLLGQGLGGATAQLQLIGRRPATDFNPITDERYQITGNITAISLASVVGTGWISVYDAINVNSTYIIDELDENDVPLQQMYARIVPNAGTYLWWLRVWIETMSW